jgi:hypothetical protein
LPPFTSEHRRKTFVDRVAVMPVRFARPRLHRGWLGPKSAALESTTSAAHDEDSMRAKAGRMGNSGPKPAATSTLVSPRRIVHDDSPLNES